ncbi:MAG: cation transporter [Bacteroidetes bacterium]|nr:cation transporter [Bacteroidota bacterium]
MKKIIFISLVIACASCNQNNESKALAQEGAVIESHAVHGAITQASFKVRGNCGTCKKTIEQAAKFKGVTFCAWDTLSKLCIVTFDSRATNVGAIQKAIADAGYDNDGYLSGEKAYSQLPECCQYERSSSK